MGGQEQIETVVGYMGKEYIITINMVGPWREMSNLCSEN